MFTNTGSLSFYLGIGFILLAFIGVLFAYRLIRSDLNDEKVEKLIELGKWFIVSVALVVSATIVGDGFREREQDVKEIEVFDKYVSTITEADGIEKRWQLAEYFSIVAPAGELRTSWENYKKVVEKHLEEYRAGKEKLNELTNLPKPNEEQKQQIVNLAEKTENYEQPLVETRQEVSRIVTQPQQWLIVAGGDKTLAAAQDELKKAQKISSNAQIYKKGNMFRTVITGFGSRIEALTRLERARSEVNKDAYIVGLQGWCKSVESGDGYLICAE